MVVAVVGEAAVALLEREGELDALRTGFDRARGGEGTLILIEGPAGAGKTELAREARNEAERAGLMPLEGKGSELEQPFAFGVVRQLLEPAVHRSDAGLFTGAAAAAARLFEIDDGPAADGDAGFEALHSLYWLVVNLADQGPLLLLVDDCQWVDLESLRFLSYLAQRIEELPVALLLSGRPPGSAEEVGSLWAQVASRPSTVALRPPPLSGPAVAGMTREQFGGEAEEEFCRACHSATGGNPLFVRELLSALRAAGVAPSSAAANEVQSVGPAAVSRFVLHRLAVLGGPASELARTVAVLGDDSELGLAARVSGLSTDAARTAADDLVRADILARAVQLGFVHPIVRAALYEDLGPGEREARHAAAADALAEEGATPERVTAHLLLTAATGDRRRVEILRAAAASAARRGAPRAAGARLRRALAERPGTEETAEMLTELGKNELAAMDYEAAEEHLREVLASDAGPLTRADAAMTLARCAMVSGGLLAEPALAALSSVAEELRPIDPERSLELGSELLMLEQTVPGLRDRLAAQIERFRDQARGHPSFEAVASLHDAQNELVSGGSAPVAVRQVEEAFAAGLQPSAGRNAVLMALITLRIAERYDLALRMLDAGLERAREEGHVARQGVIYGQRAAIALAQGSLRDAQVDTETGLRLVEEPHLSMLQLLAVAITAHVERGELETADALRERGDALGVAEDRTFLDEYLIARARLRIAQGAAEQGVSDLLWCGERLQAQGVQWALGHWRAYAAPALASLGETERAEQLADEQLTLARRVGSPVALGLSLRAAALATAEDRRLPLLEEAVAVLEPSAGRLELAYAFADLGVELGRTRRRREGRDASRRAMELAEECGATVLAERARTELQAGPGRRARIELTGPGALTAAEWRVCRQVADGHTNREVAQALFVTEKTVERHLSSVYHKLGIRSRHQLRAAIDG